MGCGELFAEIQFPIVLEVIFHHTIIYLHYIKSFTTIILTEGYSI